MLDDAGRTPDRRTDGPRLDWYTISSPCETNGSGELIKAWMSSNFGTLAPSLLIGSSSFLQVTRKTIKVWMSSNFGRIPPLTSE